MNTTSSSQQSGRMEENRPLDFEHFFKTYYPVLFQVGFRVCGDREWTKDLLQSFFLELWESRFESQKVKYLDTYLKKSFYRKAVKAVQKRRSNQSAYRDNVADLPIPSYEELLVKSEGERADRKRLQSAVDALPEEQRAVIRLRFNDGLDYQEIAAKTGKKPQTIYNQVHAAILKLRKALLACF